MKSLDKNMGNEAPRSRAPMSFRLTLGRKVALVVAIGGLLGFAIIGVVQMYNQHRQIYSAERTNKSAITKLFAVQMSDAVRREVADEIGVVYEDYVSDQTSDLVALTVYDVNGEPVTHFRTVGTDMDFAPVLARHRDELNRDFMVVEDGRNSISMLMPITHGDAKIRVGTLAVVWSLAQMNEEVRSGWFSSMGVGAVLLVLLLIVLGLVLGRMIGRPLRATVEAMRHVATGDGDLTRRLSDSGTDELAEVASAFNKFVERLQNIIVDINSAAALVGTGAQQISAGNLNLSQRTEEQASSLEETASSMEELTGTVRQNADNAKQANQLAVVAREKAESGGEVVHNAVRAMNTINVASKRIADIVGVIDEIAFQTNLLALNAAVEAARAGEQGRGFAVVAAEVRNLAQRSAASAKEIKGLIQDSVMKVDDGARLVDESGVVLAEIVTAVKKVSDIVAEIAAASLEQSTGIEHINKAITQMDDMTQQNAALVEEAAAASRSMEDQAQQLNDLVSVFKLDQDAVKPQPAQISRDDASAQAPNPVVLSDYLKPERAKNPEIQIDGERARSVPLAPRVKPRGITPQATTRRTKGANGGGEWTEF
jgi:methyl-accepting chemotaxis protein